MKVYVYKINGKNTASYLTNSPPLVQLQTPPLLELVSCFRVLNSRAVVREAEELAW